MEEGLAAGIVIPRALMGEAKRRRELDRTGVYVLVGPPEESGLPRVYVGEGDPIRPRLEQHAARKDFWTSCVAFTSKDENLNKAHVQYIESRLVALAEVLPNMMLAEVLRDPAHWSPSEATHYCAPLRGSRQHVTADHGLVEGVSGSRNVGVGLGLSVVASRGARCGVTTEGDE